MRIEIQMVTLGSGKDLHHIRSHFYKLFPGNWNVPIADLGNIKKGESTSEHPFCNHRGHKKFIKNEYHSNTHWRRSRYYIFKL